MITFLTTARHKDTLEPLFDEWLGQAAEGMRLYSYDDMARMVRIPSGVYVFTDIERLKGPLRRFAVSMARRIVLNCGAGSVVNHPEKVMLRYELLSTLHQSRINDFAVYTPGRGPIRCRYPVFLRVADDHSGSLTDLLYSPVDLRRALKTALDRRIRPSELLVGEYCDTLSEDGFYRKYSAFVIGDAIIPRHVAFGREWMVKLRRTGNRAHHIEERHYLEHNPHVEELRSIFSHSGISYGRIDYSMKGGRIQVWEINTNPVVVRSKDSYESMYMQDQLTFLHSFIDAVQGCQRDFGNGNKAPSLINIADVSRKYASDRFVARLKKRSRSCIPPKLYGYVQYRRLRGFL